MRSVFERQGLEHEKVVCTFEVVEIDVGVCACLSCEGVRVREKCVAAL